MKRVAVIQSNYLPWKGYFDIIHDVDLFIFYDDVQFTKNDWRNRNKVKTPAGAAWLTVPVGKAQDRLIWQVSIEDRRWQAKHLMTLRQHYAKAPHFRLVEPWLEELLAGREWTNLSELNQEIIRSISTRFLGITTQFRDSREFAPQGQKLDRLVDLLKKAGAEHYVSGPAARDYIDPEVFAREGIQLVYKDYGGYPEYPQFHPPFDHYVTILDLIAHTGPAAAHHVWGWRASARP